VYSTLDEDSVKDCDQVSDKSTNVGSWADDSDASCAGSSVGSPRHVDQGKVDTETGGVGFQQPCFWFPMMSAQWNPCFANSNTSQPILQPVGMLETKKCMADRHAAEGAILPRPVKAAAELHSGEARTTVMLRNMPNNYSRKMLVELMDSEGFAGQYDFVYLPIDFETKACLGYAFINMVDSASAMRFWQVFDGFCRWSIPSRKVSGVSWSGPHQGLEAHVERYRNSSIMSDSTPDDYKPALFRNGVRIPFPVPTRKLRTSRPARR